MSRLPNSFGGPPGLSERVSVVERDSENITDRFDRHERVCEAQGKDIKESLVRVHERIDKIMASILALTGGVIVTLVAVLYQLLRPH